VTSGGASRAADPGRHLPGKRPRILAWLAARNWERVTVERAAELAAAFPDVSAHTRRTALRESGLPLDALVAGVTQASFAHLEASLAALLAEYARGETRRARDAVIEAREHAEFTAKNAQVDPEKRAQKTEMALWLRIWLDNPPLFAAWVELRKRHLRESGVALDKPAAGQSR
jgi:hypothetical protein